MLSPPKECPAGREGKCRYATLTLKGVPLRGRNLTNLNKSNK